MRDLSLQPPQVGERVSRRYLERLQALAGHNHDPGVGMVTRGMAIQPPPEAPILFDILPARLEADLVSGGYANATLLTGSSRTTDGDVVEVHDTPTFITAGKQLPEDALIRIYYDSVVGEYVLLTSSVCQEDQPA